MIVLCTGMIRSGSTWSFNVCKNIMQRNGSLFSEYNESVESIFKERGNNFDNILIKCHGADEFGRLLIKHSCVKLVYTYRQPMEAIISGMQVFDKSFEEQLGSIKKSLEFMLYQKKYGAHIIHYDEIANNSLDTIRKISDYLGYVLELDEVLLINSKLSKENLKKFTDQISKNDKNVIDAGYTFYDKDTLLHRKHIRGEKSKNWKDILTQKQIEFAISSLKPYVDDSGLLIL